MPDREKVEKALEMCIKDITCSDCPYEEECLVANDAPTPMMCDALALLKEQDEQLRKLQKDKDKLCLYVSEWKHKYYDRPLKE